MALIKCPECGRENVSDSAEMCPDCGFGIKTHYDKIRNEQQQKAIYNRKLQSVKMPEEPNKKNDQHTVSIIFFVMAGLFFLLGVAGGSGFAIGISIFMLIGGFVVVNDANKKYEQEMEKYNLAKENFEKYQKEMVREQEQRAREEASKPKCPNCGSTKIEKISTTSRAISVATVGLASQKIGKQYKCNDCKHMW